LSGPAIVEQRDRLVVLRRRGVEPDGIDQLVGENLPRARRGGLATRRDRLEVDRGDV